MCDIDFNELDKLNDYRLTLESICTEISKSMMYGGLDVCSYSIVRVLVTTTSPTHLSLENQTVSMEKVKELLEGTKLKAKSLMEKMWLAARKMGRWFIKKFRVKSTAIESEIESVKKMIASQVGNAKDKVSKLNIDQTEVKKKIGEATSMIKDKMGGSDKEGTVNLKSFSKYVSHSKFYTEPTSLYNASRTTLLLSTHVNKTAETLFPQLSSLVSKYERPSDKKEDAPTSKEIPDDIFKMAGTIQRELNVLKKVIGIRDTRYAGFDIVSDTLLTTILNKSDSIKTFFSPNKVKIEKKYGEASESFNVVTSNFDAILKLMELSQDGIATIEKELDRFNKQSDKIDNYLVKSYFRNDLVNDELDWLVGWLSFLNNTVTSANVYAYNANDVLHNYVKLCVSKNLSKEE